MKKVKQSPSKFSPFVHIQCTKYIESRYDSCPVGLKTVQVLSSFTDYFKFPTLACLTRVAKTLARLSHKELQLLPHAQKFTHATKAYSRLTKEVRDIHDGFNDIHEDLTIFTSGSLKVWRVPVLLFFFLLSSVWKFSGF